MSSLYRSDLDDISNRIDFIICLGGDGTLLYASSLFQVSSWVLQKSTFVAFYIRQCDPSTPSLLCSLQESVPPVMAFHLGSLGFLTPFKFDTYQSQVTQIIEGTDCSPISQSLHTIHTPSPCPFLFTRHLDVFIFHVGNAAIVLRSRLKVRVHSSGNWETKARVDENGIILTNGDIDSSWKAVQYQVTSATST